MVESPSWFPVDAGRPRSKRSALPPVVTGAFKLPARRCTQLGRFAVVVFGATMAFGAWREPLVFEPVTELFYFSFSAEILLTTAGLAGRLSQLRENENAQLHHCDPGRQA